MRLKTHRSPPQGWWQRESCGEEQGLCGVTQRRRPRGASEPQGDLSHERCLKAKKCQDGGTAAWEKDPGGLCPEPSLALGGIG